MSQYDRMVASQREYLPKKSQKPGNPSFLWIHPPTHDSIQSKENRLHIHFAKALNSVASLHENTYALGFKKIWNPSDPYYIIVMSAGSQQMASLLTGMQLMQLSSILTHCC